MSTREEIQRARGLSDREMDELIERASRLQEHANVPAGRSVDDVKQVARELDIDSRYVDVAIEQIQRERAQLEQAQVAASAQRRRVGRIAAIVAAVAFGLAAITGVSGAGSVRAAGHAATLAQANLTTVLDRQAALVPQLVALSGGDARELASLSAKITSAPDVATRRAAADALRLAMAEQLGALPPASDPSVAQQRLSLQHEVVGAQNRITVEQRRYDEALVRWREAAESPSGRLARWLGLASSPP